MNAAFCKSKCRGSGPAALLLRLLKNKSRIRANAFVNLVECCLLRAATVLHRGADDAAGIGNEIGNGDDPSPM